MAEFIASATLRSYTSTGAPAQFIRLKTLQTRNYARAFAPSRTGRLRASIKQRTYRTNQGLVGEVYTDLFYGAIISKGGKRRYPISPVRKKALFWPGIKGGRPVNAVFSHPKIKRNQFLVRGLKAALGKGA